MKTRTATKFLALGICAAAVVLGALVRQASAAEGDTKPVELPGVEKAAVSEADKVFISGQPTQATIDAVAQKGVKVVINLRRPEETAKLAFDEKTAAKNAGMEYISVPMGTGLPKDADVKLLMDTLAASKDKPVLLHCASGNRAGAIWALYSGARKGQPVDAAIDEGEAAGLTNAALEHVVRNRIAAETAKLK